MPHLAADGVEAACRVRRLLFVVLGGGKLEPHVAHAATNSLACPVGLEQNGQFCYPPCQPGFYGEGPLCFQKCPANYQDDGALCRQDATIFAKASYGRGGGVGLSCAANQEMQGGICYPRCSAGYYGVSSVCWQACKAGYADQGATCYKGLFDFYFKATYGRGVGGAVSVCAPGLEQNGTFCYPRCNPGFYGAGPVCFQQCPTGFRDDGTLCRKDAVIFAKASYGRGVGEGMNDVPVAKDETIQTPKDTPVPINHFYSDGNDDLLDLIILKPASNGLENHNIYTPQDGFEGVDTILWKVTDGKNESNLAVTTIIVGNVGLNDAPVAVDRTVKLNEDTPITITVTCTDANNDPLLYQLLDKPQHGVYRWLPPNQVVYTPTLNFAGVDHFTFRAYDGRDFSQTSTITLTVAAVNDAPLALAQTITTTRNSNAAINLFATDAEGDPIRYTVVSSPTHGLLSGQAPSLLYTPEPNFTGADSFQFKASDPQGAATVATSNVTVQPTNTVPIANALGLTTSAESAVAVNLAASDADGDELTYTVVSSPTHGSLTGAGTDWIYLPNAAFVGDDHLTFNANDGQTDSVPATITLHVRSAPAEASLVGLVFADNNGNGQPDADEQGVGGLLVTLTPTNLSAAANLSTTTETGGGWRIDGAPLGQYTLRIRAASGIQIATPVETTMTLTQQGVQQMQPAAVKITSRSLFLPLVVK